MGCRTFFFLLLQSSLQNKSHVDSFEILSGANSIDKGVDLPKCSADLAPKKANGFAQLGHIVILDPRTLLQTE